MSIKDNNILINNVEYYCKKLTIKLYDESIEPKCMWNTYLKLRKNPDSLVILEKIQ